MILSVSGVAGKIETITSEFLINFIIFFFVYILIFDNRLGDFLNAITF